MYHGAGFVPLDHMGGTCRDVGRKYERSFAIDTGKHYLVHNRTPRRIQIVDDGHGDMRLPPLAQRVYAGQRLAPFAEPLQRLRQRHEVRVREYVPPAPRQGPPIVALALLACLAVAAADLVLVGTLRRWEAAAALAVFAAVIVVAWHGSRHDEAGRLDEEASADSAEGDVEYGLGGAFYDGNDTARRYKQAVILAVVLVIGAVMPAVAIFLASDAKGFLFLEGGLAVKDGLESRLVGRLIQVTYVAVLSLFPALMYFQFDRQRVGTLRDRWVRAIFRIDPQMKTLADVDARYGDQLAEASSYSTDSGRFLDGRHSPIIVATILISLGWTLMVLPTESFDFAGSNRASTAAAVAAQARDRASEAASGDGTDLDARRSAADAAARQADAAGADAADIAARSQGGTVPSTSTTATQPSTSDQEALDAAAASAAAAAERAADANASIQQQFFQLLDPTPSAAGMAFLGAYFFAVYLVLRSYFRGDLRPKLYSQITARLVTVVVVAYLLNVVYASSSGDHDLLWTAAFLAGVVPSTVLQRIGVAATSACGPIAKRLPWLGTGFESAFATPRSLTQIDGIDIYESARLESEGITDIPSLAKSDLVTMMISTRLPIERLVDWSDQALLVLLLNDGTSSGPAVDKRVTNLRRIGIRTATSLAEVARSRPTAGRRPRAETILGAPVLRGLAAEIAREPSIRRIEQWRRSELADIDRGWATITERRETRTDEPARPAARKLRPVAAQSS
jgi:hypothetical protein